MNGQSEKNSRELRDLDIYLNNPAAQALIYWAFQHFTVILDTTIYFSRVFHLSWAVAAGSAINANTLLAVFSKEIA